MFRAVHYINQFYGQIGGEEAAGTAPMCHDGPKGPGTGLQTLFGKDIEIVGTIICGDNAYGERMDECRAACLEMVKKYSPDVFIAGPAFNAGRYGMSCADMCAAVGAELGIPTVTAMYAENPAVEMYRTKTYIVPTQDSAAGMKKALPVMARLTGKLVKKEPMGPASDEGYLHRGIRKGFFHQKDGAVRAVEMLLAKMSGKPYKTEYNLPTFTKIPPADALQSARDATIAIITSGGVVPVGNPDRIRVSSAESWGKYDISGMERLTVETYESIHGGYDRVYANRDPNVVVPLDALRMLEKSGEIGSIYKWFYTTTGTGTAVAQAERFGREIGLELKAAGVSAAILTAT